MGPRRTRSLCKDSFTTVGSCFNVLVIPRLRSSSLPLAASACCLPRLRLRSSRLWSRFSPLPLAASPRCLPRWPRMWSGLGLSVRRLRPRCLPLAASLAASPRCAPRLRLRSPCLSPRLRPSSPRLRPSSIGRLRLRGGRLTSDLGPSSIGRLRPRGGRLTSDLLSFSPHVFFSSPGSFVACSATAA